MTAREPDFPLFGDWTEPGAGAGALVFAIDAENRALMQLRDDRPHVHAAGIWAPFGGGVEPGETLLQAALREFAEETGLTLPAAALAPFGRSLLQLPSRARLFAFTAPMPAGPEAIRLGEGAGFALFTPAQLRAIPLSPSIREMTLHLADRLEARAPAPAKSPPP
jgi:8-oxo-dGTP diphosphatase